MYFQLPSFVSQNKLIENQEARTTLINCLTPMKAAFSLIRNDFARRYP